VLLIHTDHAMFSQLAAVPPPHHLPCSSVPSKGLKQHLAAAPRCQKHVYVPLAPGTRHQEAQQLRSCVAAAAPGSSPSNAAVPAAEPSDAGEEVAVSTMDALLTVMDDGTSEPDEQQAAAAGSSGREVPAAVLEAAAEELSEGGSSFNPEDAMRYVSSFHSCMRSLTAPGLSPLCSRSYTQCSCQLSSAQAHTEPCLHSCCCCSHACSANASNLACAQRPAESLCQHSGACSPRARGTTVSSRGVRRGRQLGSAAGAVQLQA
jgi:hypothetical protein